MNTTVPASTRPTAAIKIDKTSRNSDSLRQTHPIKGGGALCAGNAVALLVFGPVMP